MKLYGSGRKGYRRREVGIGMKKVIFGIVILCLVMFMCPRTPSPEKKGEFSKKDK
jgi:hypothetical protein